MLHNPCILGDPQQKEQHQRTRKIKKQKKISILSTTLFGLLLIAPTGNGTHDLIALPTRVWAISDIPLHRGGIHIWSMLVFIHHWVLVKKWSILSTDT